MINIQNRSLTLKLNNIKYITLGLSTTHNSFITYIRQPHSILNHYLTLKISHPQILEIALFLSFYSNAELTIKYPISLFKIMFFLLNQELVEICSFVKTFETEPSLRAFILVNLKNVTTQKKSTLSVHPTSVYWNYFHYLLENESKCARNISTETNKLI